VIGLIERRKIMHYGTIVFQLINIGSKSEGLHPFLYEGKGEFLKVWLEEDCSFEGDALKPYDGKSVIIEGALDEEIDIFIIENIQEYLLTNPERDVIVEVPAPDEEQSGEEDGITPIEVCRVAVEERPCDEASGEI
jgi:hypothetical protein